MHELVMEGMKVILKRVGRKEERFSKDDTGELDIGEIVTERAISEYYDIHLRSSILLHHFIAPVLLLFLMIHY